MIELLNKIKSIEVDIKDMPPFDKVKYTSNLYNEFTNTHSIVNEEIYFKAKDHLESVLYYVIADYKSSMILELEHQVAQTHYCSIEKKKIKENNILLLVKVRISDKFFAEIHYNWDKNIRLVFYQNINDVLCNRLKLVIRWKVVPEWLKQSSKFVSGHFEKEVTIKNWVNVVMETARDLRQHNKDVIALCIKSSNSDDNGNMVKQYKTWKTKGKILSIKKEMPIIHIFHAKKSLQDNWNNSPFVHGSNGTYAENANPSWILRIIIYHPSYDDPDPLKIPINIHDYITKSLMPQKGWGRVTKERLEWLNKTLHGKRLELETADTSKASLYRSFLPKGFKNWDTYLDSILL